MTPNTLKRKAMEKLKKVFCALFRHSNIETVCFGYHSCARCGEQLGDSLAGAYQNKNVVGVRCDCDECRKNYAAMGFMDTFLSKKPEWLAQPPGWSKRKAAQSDQNWEKLKHEMENQQA
jgi:hypothetical protein